MGRCERDALPGMVVCGEHATRDALVMNIRNLSAKAEKLEAEVERLTAERARLDKAWGLEKRGLLDRINELVYRSAIAEQRIEGVRNVLTWEHTSADDLRQDIQTELRED